MSLTLQAHNSIAEIGCEAWNGCADSYGDPFVSYAFLHACEASDSAVPSQGWAARHLSLRDEADTVLGVMPLYLKGHSQGEYVFDHSWADAYQRAGGRYYPKLLSAVPFTPATGPRLLVHPDTDQDAARQTLVQGAIRLTEQIGVSSLHVNFPVRDEWLSMGEAGMLLRQDMQFIWNNEGYSDFEGFLAALSSNRRKTIRRERREARADLDIRILTGSDITEAHWDAFFAFYLDTGSRKWGRPYLTRAYFSMIGETMADQIALVMAFRNDQAIAGALNFIGRDALYGRQWGTLEDIPFLHFELCYYSAIEFAIERGLSRVEAGAQGEHKIARGYLPAPVYSAHFIADPALREPVRRYLVQERQSVDEAIEEMGQTLSPYRSR